MKRLALFCCPSSRKGISKVQCKLFFTARLLIFHNFYSSMCNVENFIYICIIKTTIKTYCKRIILFGKIKYQNI